MHVITYLSKHTECTSRVNPKVNYEVWVIMMCQYRFINFNRSTTLVGNDESGGGYACVEAGAMWEISVPFSQNFCELALGLAPLSLCRAFAQSAPNPSHCTFSSNNGP